MQDPEAVHLLNQSTHDSEADDFDFRRKKSRKYAAGLNSLLIAFSSRPLGIRRRKQLSRGKRARRQQAAITILNVTVLTILLLILLSIIDGLFNPSYANPPTHYQEFEEKVHAASRSGRGNPRNEKIFIASNIIQAEMINGPWGDSLLALIDLLGPENVFVSIYENDSGNSSVEALTHLASKIQSPHSITTGAHLPLSDVPSIILPNGQPRVKRITYLSEVRNHLLLPLEKSSNQPENLQVNHTDTRFDRVLFLNDIYFKPIDALHLLFSTNVNPSTGLADYDVACAVDFVAAVMFYDSFVVRDFEGYGMGLMFFPWFTSKGKSISRNDVLAEKDAVRVQSCWGGMVSFAAAPFQEQPPLKFRHQTELYWEASECCLIHADLAQSSPKKIFLNPYVRVAYDAHSWSWMPFTRRIERVFKILQYFVSAIGYPEYNPRRLEVPGQESSQLRWIYDELSLNGETMRDQSRNITDNLSGKWLTTPELAKPGGFCGQRRLFVMKPDVPGANAEQKGRNWEKGPWP